jgi:hypothetical protein
MHFSLQGVTSIMFYKLILHYTDYNNTDKFPKAIFSLYHPHSLTPKDIDNFSFVIVYDP